MPSLGHKIAQARTERGFSVNRLAKKSGVREGTIRAWERGAQPRVDNLAKVANCLGIALIELLEAPTTPSTAPAPAMPGLAKVRTNLEEVEGLVREARGILDATADSR
jgi:transcriptional regulator with XRE-family HTH domain